MDQRQSLLGDSGSSISCENVSAFTFSTRGSFGFFTPPAYPVRSCPGLERLIQAVLPGKLSRPDPVPDGLSSSGLGPRADHPKAAALGAVSRSAYIIGTRPTSLSGLGLLHWDSGPEQTARTPRRRPSKSGQCHGHGPGHGGRPTSSGLGLSTSTGLGLLHRDSGPAVGADRPNAAALRVGAFQVPHRGYVPVQAGVPVQGRRRRGRAVRPHHELPVQPRAPSSWPIRRG